VTDTAEAKAAGLMSDHFQLIPSFFTLLASLESSERGYSITLRGFATGLVALAAAELAAYLERRHPVYGTDRGGKHGYRPSGNGALVGGVAAGCGAGVIREGVFDRSSLGCSLTMHNADKGGGGAGTKPGGGGRAPRGGERATDPGAILSAMLPPDVVKQSVCQERPRCSAILDSSSWWEKKKTPSAGKYFPLRRAETEVHAIFFDVKAWEQVDARDCQDQHVPYQEVAGIHLMEVDPLLAMRDEEYFTQALAQAEARYEGHLGDRAPSSTFGLTEVF